MDETLERFRSAVADHYAIDREIGRGGMATVYLALDLKHNRKVAVKVLLAELTRTVTAERFLREIEIAAGLAHPNVVPVYDSGEADGLLYYVMPYLDGESLQHRLRHGAPFAVDEAQRVAREVAGALAYAHKQDIIHRDIKPGNILFVDGHAMVTDFGIGKAVCDACDDDITLIGTLVGTPHYMSPEQGAGEAVGPPTDVYSLGCVLYEMLTGQLPFPADTAQAAMARHAVDPIPSVRDARPEVPEQLATVIEKALAKKPEDRYETAAALADVLHRAGTLPDTAMWSKTPRPTVGSLPPTPGRRRGILAAAVLAALLAIAGGWWALAGGGEDPIQSVAVLPFANLSGDAEQAYFVDGMHDLLISELSQIDALTVISRTSVMQYRSTDRSVPEIARELGVDAVVEGSVFRATDSVRINAQLIRAHPERHLWAASYAKPVEMMFALQAEVARAIADEIEAELTPQDEARFAAAPPVDHAVHDAYLQARYHHAQGTLEEFREAIRHYNRALQEDPQFAQAHAGLALSLHLLTVYGGGPARETEPQAMMHAERALALDDGLAEAHAVLAGIKSMYEWDWTAAGRAYRRALAVDRNSASARQWYAYHLSAMGRHDEAVAQARRGLELDPLNPMGRAILADQLIIARRYDEAADALGQALEMDPDYDRALDLLEWVYALRDQYDEAVELRRSRLTRPPTSPADSTAAARLRESYRQRGPEGYWRWRIANLQQVADSGYVAPSRFAKLYAALRDRDQAFEWLEKAYDARDGVEMLNVWPGYDSLRGDPRFDDLRDRMHFPD